MLDSVWRRLKQKLCHPKKKYDQKNKINKIVHAPIDRTIPTLQRCVSELTFDIPDPRRLPPTSEIVALKHKNHQFYRRRRRRRRRR